MLYKVKLTILYEFKLTMHYEFKLNMLYEVIDYAATVRKWKNDYSAKKMHGD